MQKPFLIFILILLAVAAILLIGSGFMNAQSSLAQSRALETLAISQLVNQVFTGLLVISAGVLGSLMTLAVQKIVRLVRKPQAEPQHWVSGPNANWGQLGHPQQTQLRVPPPAVQNAYPAPAYFQINPPQPQYVEVQNEEEEPLGFGGW